MTDAPACTVRQGGEAPPVFQGVLLSCAKCQNEWVDYIATQCDFAIAIATMNVITRRGCPACGASGKSVLLKKTPYPAIEAAPGKDAVNDG